MFVWLCSFALFVVTVCVYALFVVIVLVACVVFQFLGRGVVVVVVSLLCLCVFLLRII